MVKGGFSIVNIVFKAVTYLLLLLLALSYLSPYVSPEYTYIIPFVGLAAPIIIFANIIAAVYWIMRWDRVAILCVAVLILGIGNVAKFIQIPVVKDMVHEEDALKVISFNAHYFTTSNHKDVVIPTLKTIDSINADIICIQEFATSRQDNMDDINKIWKRYPYRYLHSTRDSSTKVDYFTAIYSKYRIVGKGELHFKAIANSSIYADILYRKDTIRVFNNHLQSSSMTSADIKFLSGEDKSYSGKGSGVFRMFSIGRKMSWSDKLRAIQADSIRRVIDNTSYDVIVCGDHNVTPMSYTYNKVRGDLHDAFVNKGKWYGYTYKSFGNFLRIDFVFHSDGFKTLSYSSPNIMYSDHKPVIVELKRQF